MQQFVSLRREKVFQHFTEHKSSSYLLMYMYSVFKNYYGVLSLIESRSTVRPLLSAPLLSAELDYPQFLRTNFSTPNFYEIQSDLYDSHLYYPRTSFIRGFWDQNLVRPSTADNRGLTVEPIKTPQFFFTSIKSSGTENTADFYQK